MAEPSVDFDSLYEQTERGFFGTLLQCDGPNLVKVIRSEQTALFESKRDLARDEPSTFHLRCATLVLAAYRVLLDSVPKDDAFEKVRGAFIEPTRADTLREMGELINTATDPFRDLVAHTKCQEEQYLGTTFKLERVQDDDHAYKVHVHECFYHRFFSENGAPELTKIACDINNNWIDAIDPTKHAISFERPAMLGYGGDQCEFYFYRLPMVQEEGNSTSD
jgi:hypothetical protein